MTTINLPDFSTQRDAQKRAQESFEEDYAALCTVLRRHAKKAVYEGGVTISHLLQGDAKDYYNACLTQLSMYR